MWTNVRRGEWPGHYRSARLKRLAAQATVEATTGFVIKQLERVRLAHLNQRSVERGSDGAWGRRRGVPSRGTNRHFATHAWRKRQARRTRRQRRENEAARIIKRVAGGVGDAAADDHSSSVMTPCLTARRRACRRDSTPSLPRMLTMWVRMV